MRACEIVLEWWWVRALWNIRPHSRWLILAPVHCTPLQYLSHRQINRVTEASTVSLLLPEPFPETAVGGEKERVWRYRRRSRRRIERKTRESMELEQQFLQNSGLTVHQVRIGINGRLMWLTRFSVKRATQSFWRNMRLVTFLSFLECFAILSNWKV